MTPSNTQIPPQFSSVFGLGTPKQVFLVKKGNKWGSLIGGLICLGIAGVGFLAGAYVTYSNVTKFGPATTNQQLQNVMLPAACVAGVFF